jgi:branched-chain amino acid transport system permease protein
MIVDILISGLIGGSMYALLAIGFSLIFGVARIVNIAHTAFGRTQRGEFQPDPNECQALR